MSKEINTTEKNRVLAEFMGWEFTDRVEFIEGRLNGKLAKRFSPMNFPNNDFFIAKFKYHTDRNALHEVWAKFRELNTQIEPKESYLRSHKGKIIKAMAYGTLTDFYSALVNAVEWYNSTVK